MYDFGEIPDFSKYYSYEQLKEWYPEIGTDNKKNAALAGAHMPHATLLPRKPLQKITGRLSFYRSLVGRHLSEYTNYRAPSRPKWFLDKLERLDKIGELLRYITFSKQREWKYPDNVAMPFANEGLYVYAKVDSHPNLDLRGWITYSPFKEGDEVEIIYAENVPGKYEVYAIARVTDRIVALTPNCYDGKKRGYLDIIPTSIICGLVSGVLGTIVFLIKSFEIGVIIFFPLFMLLGSVGYLVFLILSLSRFIASQETSPVLFEAIFGLLGVDNASSLNIKRKSNKKIKKMVKAGVYKDEVKNYKERMPTRDMIESIKSAFFY